jgi:putative membrane protein
VIVAGASGWIPLFKRLGPLVIGLFAYDSGVTILNVYHGVKWLSVTDLPLPLLGSALGVFLGLRNSLSYARWWEARTLWGAAVNNSRSLVRSLIWALPGDARAWTIGCQQIAWAHALRCRLRKQEPWDDIAPLLDADVLARVRRAVNPPTALQAEQARVIAQAIGDRTIDTIKAANIDRVLSDIANAQGGLERIANTPLPRHFDDFPQIFVLAYCLLLPVGMVADLGVLTPLGSSFLGLIFLALDSIGRDLEAPFANTVHDVPMTAITRNIEIDLRQMLGESDVPKPLQPVGNVLW